ncbi:MAG: ATP-binding cassette domain-containing protein [Chloroflexi bacterium]|nr:ATP-binding cassette domain-containing protein [Chloroflexota bacterium]
MSDSTPGTSVQQTHSDGPLVRLHGVDVTLAGNSVLHNLNWELHAGEHWAIVGANGSGKTSFLRLVAGTLWPAPNSGTRRYDFGRELQIDAVQALGKITLIGHELQDRYTRLGWNFDAVDVVLSGLKRTSIPRHEPAPQDRIRARGMLRKLKLLHLAERPFLELSRGEQRRILIARGLAFKPIILILDEPVAGLDAKSRRALNEMIEQISADITVLCSYHQAANLPRNMNRMLRLADGHVVESGPISATSNAYGDHSDFMGNSLSWHHLNGAHMDQMGWSNEGSLVNVFAGGVYDLYPVGDDAALGGLRVLKIAKSDSNEFYYLSYRQRGGYDTTLSSTYTQGVNIHRYRGSGATMTYFLRSLADGGQFEDQVNGITITQLGRAVDNSYVTVAIDFGCAIGNPTISLAPAEQGLAPGETTSHTVYLSNNDVTGCPATTFDLSASFESGLTGSLSVDRLTLLPGETGTAVLQVTAGALDGTYLATVTALDGDGLEPNHSGTFEAAATLIIDATAPSAPTGLSAALSSKGDQVSLAWDIAGDGDGSGVASYRIYRDAGAGFVEIGQSGRTDYTDGSVAFDSTYSYLVTSVDQASNESADSATVAITTGKTKTKAKGGGGKRWGKGGKSGA